MAVNSHKLTWVNPTQNTDGTAYDAAARNAGYDLAIDGTTPTVALPFALGSEFTIDKNVAAYDALPSGNHTVRLRVVTKEGVTSDWTAPGTFSKIGTPKAVTAFAIA